MRHHPIPAILAFCMLLFLTACSNLVPPSSTNTYQFLTSRNYQTQIDMSGRMSAQYEQKNGPQSIHINFSWSQTPQQTLVTLISPTGQTLATLLINDQGAQLNQGNKPPRYAGDANQLLSDMLGWPLPVAGLRNWLQGFIDDGHNPPITSESAKDTFTVDGWKLRYTDWKIEQNIERPKRLDLSRQTEQAGLVSLRIVVDEWNY